jgi:hypothetical protein
VGYEEMEVYLLPQIKSRACGQVPETPKTICPSSRRQSVVRMEGGEKALLVPRSGRLKYGSTSENGPAITER